MSIRLRRADAADIPLIAVHRARMFAEIHTESTPEQALSMKRLTEAFLSVELSNGAYRHWFAELAGQPVAGGGLHVRAVLPWTDPQRNARSGHQAIILNMFTEPNHRGQGIARRVLEELHSHLRAEGIENIVLHASDQGRPLYTRMGYVPTNEMRLWLS